MKEKFEDILVYDDSISVFARNGTERILFRYCKLDGVFSIFRSPRMTEEEKEFCLIMFRRLTDERNLLTEGEILSVLDYSMKKDIYCS
jgi:hypothetical protein